MKSVFFAASDYPMLGMSEVIPDLRFSTYYGEGSHCINPPDINRDHGGDFTRLSNNLLVSDYLKKTLSPKPGEETLALFVMYDEETIRRVRALGLKFGHVDVKTRDLFDHKIRMSEYARSLEIPQVNHIIFHASRPPSYSEVIELLGERVVVQHPFGSSAETTFMVNGLDKWNEVIHRFKDSGERLRVCEYIDCFCICVDACVVGDDALVGPLMSEINGNSRLTTTEKSWCGNQVLVDEISDGEQKKVQNYVRKIGRFMATKGYKGYYSVDLLYDKKRKRAFFSEVNPRVSGASTVANLSMHHAGLKTLLEVHIDQYAVAPKKFDLDNLNREVLERTPESYWSQIVFKNLEHQRIVRKIPKRGIVKTNHLDDLCFDEFSFSMPSLNKDHIYFTPEACTGDKVSQDSEIGSLLSQRPLYTAVSGELMDLAVKSLNLIQDLIEFEQETYERD